MKNRYLISLGTIVLSLILMSCNSLVFRFDVAESEIPATFDPTHKDADIFGYVPAQPGYKFNYVIKTLKINENTNLFGWTHDLRIEFSVKNIDNYRSFLPNIGVVLLNEDASQMLPQSFQYPHFGSFGGFSSSLSYLVMDPEGFITNNSLGAKESVNFYTLINLSSNSNEKFSGLFYLHFLEVPKANATHANTNLNSKGFIEEHTITKMKVNNISSIYSF
jgi:hypothetical protein